MKTRIISAIIMLAVFIPILLLGDIYYSILSCILGMIALWELMRLEKNIPLYMRIISYFICLFLIIYHYKETNYFTEVNYAILVSMFFIYSFSSIINKDTKKYTYKDSLWLMTMTLLIGIMFNSFIRIRLLGLYPVIYCFLISTMTDTFALFGGKLFGKHKLAPLISPNKTIEGSIVGSLFGTIISSIFYYFVIGNMSIEVILLLSFVLTIFGQMGDLFFSNIKRFYNVKDFSNIIPGHGGILDRLDSVIFVILGYLLYILII